MPTCDPVVDEKQKELEGEIRDMISVLTHRLSHLQTHVHKPLGGDHHQAHDHDEHGIRIITMAGSNMGATMRSELLDPIDDKSSNTHHPPPTRHEHDPNGLTSYLNSNFQAINNSIMLGGSYTTNDPGVHLDVSDHFTHDHHHQHHKHEAASKGKKKDIVHSD